MKFNRVLEEKKFPNIESAEIYAKKVIASYRRSYAADSEEGDKYFSDGHLEFTTSGGDSVRADWEYTDEADYKNKEVVLTISSRF